jgi:hypothetical protein
MKLNQLEWIDDDDVANVVHHQLIAKCQLNVTKTTRWGWKDMGLLSWHMKTLHFSQWFWKHFTQHYTKPSTPHHTRTLPNHAHSEESASPICTKVVNKCNVTPPKTKKPNFALPILGIAKLNLWNAIPSVNMRQACRGTKSELKIKHRANEHTCILHVVEECKIRLWHY